MLQPGPQITIWHNGLSHPHSYLFSTSYPNATTPRSYQTVSLLKHLLQALYFLQDNSLAWQARSWESGLHLPSCPTPTIHFMHRRTIQLFPLFRALLLCFLSHSCESLQPKMPISIFSVWKSTFSSMLTSVKPFSDFHLLHISQHPCHANQTFSYICLYMSMFSKSPWAP